MGSFSWCCAVCDQEILASPYLGYSKFNLAKAIWSNGDRISGAYDGYGRLGKLDFSDLMFSDDEPKLVHESCWREGMNYASIKDVEYHASYQGSFPGERLAEQFYGPPDLSEIEKVRRYVCYECHHTWDAHWSGGRCPFGCERPAGWPEYRELVEPLKWLDHGGMCGNANGLGICRNEHVGRKRWKENGLTEKYLDKCWNYGDVVQTWVKSPDFDQSPGIIFVPRCIDCGSADHFETIELIDAPLQMLGAVSEKSLDSD